MCRSRNFARGVQARLPENGSDVFFLFSHQLILHFYSGLSMFYFKENYKFPRFQRESNIFQEGGGGPTFSRGGGGLNANLYRNPENL